jgi:hypothetical protein
VGAIRSVLRAACAGALLWGGAADAQGVDPRLNWRTLETDHFQVHFAEQHRSQAILAATVAERVYPRVTGMLRWEPRARTHVILMDSADFSNGFAWPLPFNHTGIWLSPPDEGELLQNREWLEMVLTHELFHIVHLDKAHGAPLAFRNIFGRTFFPPFVGPFFSPFPNLMQPPWIMEGLAVYAESDTASGYGRLGHSHFEGMMRAEWERGLRSLREINADGRGFPLNRNYLYGGYFFAFMRDRYGEKAVTDFVENYSNRIVPFRVHTNPVRVTGKPMDALWDDYQAWLGERFGPKAGAASQPAAEGAELARAWSLSSPTLGRDGTRWYVEANGYTRPRLMRQKPGGAPEAVRQVEYDTRLDASAGDGVLVAQHEICRNYNLLYDLYRVEEDGDIRRLTECARHRFASQPGDGRIATVRVTGGTAEVVLLDQTGREQRTLYRTAPGESLSGVAAKGESVVVTSLRDGRWSLLEVGSGKVEVLLSDAALKHSPRFGDTADEIYFVADYGKVYNVWSLSRASGALSRWTHAPRGVREASAPVRGEVLLTTIEADGDALRAHRLPDAPLERRGGVAPAPVAERGADRPPRFTEDDYSPLSSLLPRWWAPIFEFYDGAVVAGVATGGQDALGVHQYYLAPAYEFKQGEPLGTAWYMYDERHSLLLSRDMVIKTNEKTDGFPGYRITSYETKEDAQALATWRHLALNRRIYWGIGYALEREKLHDAVNDTAVSQHDERVAALVAGIDTRRAHRLSEGPSQGQWLRLFAETSNGTGGAFKGNVYRVDGRIHFPLWRATLGARWMEAYAQPQAEEFQLGGSKSDDYIPIPILNQHEFALRGYTSGEPSLRGHRARVITAEARVPLADIDRHLMVPPIGINRIALNVFMDAGTAWDRGGSPYYHKGYGVEVMLEPRVGYIFGAHARLGIARGVDTGGQTQVYLRAGRSF